MNINIETKFNIGDEVVVSDAGKVYSTYESWADKNGLNDFKNNRLPDEGYIGYISVIGLHETFNDILYGVNTLKGDFIIDERGISTTKPVKE